MTESHELSRYNSLVSKLNSDDSILADNKLSIRKFLTRMEVQNVSKARLRHIIEDMFWWAKEVGKPFTQLTREDVEEAVLALNKMQKPNGAEYSGHVKVNRALTFKTFIKYLNQDVVPASVAWLNRTTLNIETATIQAKDLLTPDEYARMLKSCKTDLEAAILSVLFESGARRNELVSLTISSVNDKGNCMVLTCINSKRRKGSSLPKTRPVYLVYSAKYLQRYLNTHPDRHNPDAPLWISDRSNSTNTPISGEGLLFILKRIAKRARIKKRVWVHLGRHMSATENLSKLPSETTYAIMGWAPGSKMAKVYSHLTTKHIEDAVLASKGVKTEEAKSAFDLDFIACPNCNAENPPSHIICDKCGRALSVVKVVESEKQIIDLQSRLEMLEEGRRIRVQKRIKGIKGR